MRRVRFLGHPVHPPLTHFPLALLMVPFPLLLAAKLGAPAELLTVAKWCEALGLLAAMPAVVTGLLDYAALPEELGALDAKRQPGELDAKRQPGALDAKGQPDAERQPSVDRAMSKASLHMIVMLGAVSAMAADFIVAWVARDAGGLIFLRLMLTGAGFAAMAAGGYLGADLVWTHGVGHRGSGGESPGVAGRQGRPDPAAKSEGIDHAA